MALFRLLQTPLSEIVIYHPDQEYLDDINTLSKYIEDELNVRQVRTSSDEAACGVRWRVTADWPVLGKKLRKDMARVKKALPDVTSEQVKQYLATGKIDVDGITLEAGDLATSRYVEVPSNEVNGASTSTSTSGDKADDHQANGDAAPAHYVADTDNDVVILLDITVRPDFVKEAYAREMINRVQRSRKRAGCQATDDMDVYIHFEDEEARTTLGGVLQTKAEVFSRVMRRVPDDDGQRDKSRPVFFDDPEVHEVGGCKFNIVILQAGV